MTKTKEAVGNLGAEELSFLKSLRLTHADTARQAEALFTVSHHTLDRDTKLLNKLFVQTPGALSSRYAGKSKEASANIEEQFAKIKVAYNVYHFFESGADKTAAQRRFPELLKAAGSRGPSMTIKKVQNEDTKVGNTMPGATTTAGARV